ncbi:MAG TPA: kelch repeat-containing protein [Phycisphaerales bacterium]|nr:kelch repeat-containing protein [Phycisphaerales bacterium]
MLRLLGAVLLVLCVMGQTAARGQSVVWQEEEKVAPPSGRNGHAMAYDSARGVTVLFGGDDGNGIRSGETWEWNGTKWRQVLVSGPSARRWHAMAYDSARGVTVLFGGQTASGRNG